VFAWTQLDFSAIPVSISALTAVSLTGGQTWQNVNSKRRCKVFKNVQEWKRYKKKEKCHCFCLCSFCFWGEVSNTEFSEVGSAIFFGGALSLECYLF
jgi:hypothetical protein